MLPINHDYRQRYKILDKNIEDKNIYDIIKFILVLNLPIVAIFFNNNIYHRNIWPWVQVKTF